MGRLLGAAVALAASTALVSCSGPKSATIPLDTTKWDSLKGPAQKLSDEDRKEFTAYMLRKITATSLASPRPAIAPGTTIGDAIKEQRKVDADEKQAEADADIAKAKVNAEVAAAAARLSQSATIALANMTFVPKNISAERFSDRINFTYAVTNKTNKEISGIKGRFIFTDLFGTTISNEGLSLDKTVPPNSTIPITGYGRDLNQFDSDDTKLATTPFQKIKATFQPQMIVFSDGTKIEAPDALDVAGKAGS